MDSQQMPGQPERQPSTAYPPSAAGNGKKSFKTWVLVGAGAAALVVAGAGISAATGSRGVAARVPTTQSPTTGQGPGHDGMHRKHGVGGTIASVDGSTLTVTDRSGAAVTVTTTADTRITRATKGVVADVKVGDNVLVMGPTTGTDVTAKRIVDTRANPLPTRPPKDDPDAGQPPPAGHPAPVAGQVTVVDGGTITVQAAGGTYQVTTSADTGVSLVDTLAVGDLKVGDQVHVMGDTTGNTVTGKDIRVGDVEGPRGHPGPGSGMHGPGMEGPGMEGPGGHHRGPDVDQDDSGTTDSSGTSAPTTL